MNARTVRCDPTRGERIAEDVLNAVRGTDLAKGVVLDRLARATDQAAELDRLRAPPVPPPPRPQ